MKGQRGMVTVEIAVALPALVLVTALGIWGVTAASIKLACLDAARSGARAAARGESLVSVRALVARSVPAGATIRIARDSGTSRVEIDAPVKGPVAADLPPLVIRVRATAVTEPGTVELGGSGSEKPGARVRSGS
ncbi:TadE family type IV pilus minor pilin [Actinomadura sp. NBRC 104412]|uniref:TadE family type IV pilus minor pilin n=1 Tax=Actinomadura sp. NBRC 104412 TaxID=3032203 RepID=UPI002554A621|nr:TadE family type IV pilus minor pilin [Actinomadura sp. NBRC 104412]